MIAASLAVFAMAALFVTFGLLKLGEGQGCGGSDCGSCSHDCEIEASKSQARTYDAPDFEAGGRLP